MIDRATARDLVAALRREFDEAFAEARVTELVEPEALLEVTCGQTHYAFRLTEISGLLVDVAITPVASPMPELRGIAGVRGANVPVYDFAALLGHPPDPQARWVVLAGGTTPVGLAFARLNRHVKIRRDAITGQNVAAAPQHVGELVDLPNGARPVVSIASLVDEIGRRVRAHRHRE